ncbi:MAG: heparinase II/III-family protein [Victivallaceae bacterium]|nr:heparinase II/III-family protein [Victivallaceae bacterium]
MLTDKYNRDFLLKAILPQDKWYPFPAASDRPAWEKIKTNKHLSAIQRQITEQAENALSQPWPELLAEDYMAYARTGNRDKYQQPYFTRRNRLSALVMAECLEYKGKFIDEIINGIWSIISEPSWCLPAHSGMLSKSFPSLPQNAPDVVDLFASQTAFILGEVLFLLKDKLNSTAPELEAWVKSEIDRRIISEVEQSDDYSWFKGYNNWSAWCTTNVIGAAMYTIDDHERLVNIFIKMMTVMDRFIDNQPEDGTCLEGAMYWHVAAGNLLIFLEMLYSRSGGKVNVFDAPLIKAMGNFAERVNIDNEYFLAFGDTVARSSHLAPIIYRYGSLLHDESLQSLAIKQLPAAFSGNDQISKNIIYLLRTFAWVAEDENSATYSPDLTKWLPEIQLLVARECSIPGKGMVLGAVGGHNGLSHNHCDVGVFSIFCNGAPFIIDMGKGEYTRQTFYSARYDILWTRSKGHNVPLINDCEQLPGGEYGATNVTFTDNHNCTSLAMDIDTAYPDKCDLKKLRREMIFNRSESRIEISDKFEFSGEKTELLIPLYIASQAKQLTAGKIALIGDDTTVIIEYDPTVVDAEIEDVLLEDKILEEVWQQKKLRRIWLRYRKSTISGEIKLVIYHAKCSQKDQL